MYLKYKSRLRRQLNVDHSDVVGATPVGAASTTSSFLTSDLASMDWANWKQLQDETRNISVLGFSAPYIRDLTAGPNDIASQLNFVRKRPVAPFTNMD